MPLKGKHIKNNSVPQDKLNVSLDSIIDEYDATIAEYVDTNSNSRVGIVTTSILNNMMSANNASVGQIACGTPVVEFPISSIRVLVNNVEVTVGEGQECYFTPDGEIIRNGGNAEKGDILIWNSSNYDLEDTDKITFDYYTSNYVVEVSSGGTHELDKYNTAVNIKYTGANNTNMTFIIDGVSFVVGDVNGSFVWDIGGANEHTFTSETESIVQDVNGIDYTIWFDGFGSLLYSVKKGNLKPYIPAIFEIETTSANETFTIPHLSGNYDYEVDWGDGSPTQRITSYNDPNTTHTYASGGTYDIKINGVCDTVYFNNDGDKNKLKTIKSLGNIKWKGLNFKGCANLVSLSSGLFSDVSNLNVLTNMFFDCSSLISVDVSKWDTSNVTTLSHTFYNCSSLISVDVSKWDTSNVTSLYRTFMNCVSLVTLDVSKWNVSSVTSTYNLFSGCRNIVEIDMGLWVLPTSPNMTSMFFNCRELTTLKMDNFDFTNTLSFSHTFYYCSKLTSLDVSNWDVSSVTSFNNTFYYCSKLTSLGVSNWDVSSATSLSGMFNHCGASDIDISSWIVTNVNNVTSMFMHCSSITEIAPDWWNTQPQITSYSNCFYNNTNRPNYNLIPSAWGGGGA